MSDDKHDPTKDNERRLERDREIVRRTGGYTPIGFGDADPLKQAEHDAAYYRSR